MLHTDSGLFKNSFGTDRMRELFSEPTYVDRFMQVEAALARAEADVGLIPAAAAEEITATATVETIELEAVERKVEEIALYTMSIIEVWREAIGEAGEYIHWGATSQDIGDTVMVLLARDAIAMVRDELVAIRDTLAAVATDHRETPMIGRTHHVHAIPMTFGLKTATWLDEIDRGIDRLDAVTDRLFVLQFFGAVGTLASLGEDGLAVQERLGEELDLAVPNTAWYAARDRTAELLNVLATIGGTLARIARQVLVLGRDEIGEIGEPVPAGKVGSSTMPHKKNPKRCEGTLGLAAMIRGTATVLNQAMETYDERDAGLLYTEFGLIPEAFHYLDRAAQNVRGVLADLTVRPDRMVANLSLHDGLVASEAVMMALADELGRQAAHEVVYEVAMESIATGEPFPALLRQDDRVSAVLSDDEIDTLTDPTEYTGVSAALVDRTVDDVGR